MRLRRLGLSVAVLVVVSLAWGVPTLSLESRAASPAAGSIQLLHVVFGPAAKSPQGFAPSTIRNHYHFNAMGKDAKGTPITGTGQTIGIVLWGNYPLAATDLQTFITQFSLAPMLGLNGKACSPSGYKATPCFKVVRPGKTVPNPSNPSTDAEYALDIEWAHVAAPGANIVLVQGQATVYDPKSKTWTPDGDELDQAIKAAVSSGASVVSMSFSGPTHAATWDGLNVAFVAGEGDQGFPETSYPAADPNVLSVGGTNITPDGEPAWVYTGGGVTGNVRPGYQLNWTSSAFREVNDVAYNAEGQNATRYLGYSVSVQDTAKSPMVWAQIRGVSAGIPQWAGIIADADQLRASHGKSILARSGVMAGLYLAATTDQPGVINKAYFTDVTTGCAYGYKEPPKTPVPPCVADATKGYDQLTGLGTPDVGNLVYYLGYDI